MFQLFKRSRRSPSVRPPVQLGLEALEDRQLLSATALSMGLPLAPSTAPSSVQVAQPPSFQGSLEGSSGMGLSSPTSLLASSDSSSSGAALKTLGTSPTTSGVYVADANNEVYQWNGSGWQDLGQGANAPDGSFWFLGGPSGGPTGSPLYHSVNGQIVQQSGAWTQLLGISSDGAVWVANGTGVYSGDGVTWTSQTSAAAQALSQSPGLGAAVTAYARQFIGQTDPPGSSGECTDLVMASLQQAGAKTTEDFGVDGPDANYVWGTLVADHSVINVGGQAVASDAVSPLPIRAGDIIQLQGVTVVTHGLNPDGSGWIDTTVMDHHSVIIEAVLGGGSYRVLEQNWDGGNPDGRVVRESILNLGDMTQGEYSIYQPVAQ